VRFSSGKGRWSSTRAKPGPVASWSLQLIAYSFKLSAFSSQPSALSSQPSPNPSNCFTIHVMTSASRPNRQAIWQKNVGQENENWVAIAFISYPPSCCLSAWGLTRWLMRRLHGPRFRCAQARLRNRLTDQPFHCFTSYRVKSHQERTQYAPPLPHPIKAE
jgi:hypothetical protein